MIFLKKIVAGKRYESNQSSFLAETNKKIAHGEGEIELLQSVLTKTKIAKKKQRIASLEKERQSSKKKKDWCTGNISMHQGIIKIIEMATLIPPSTAEVERSFSLINLISTPLCKRLSAENLGYCMRICTFPRSLTENDYQQILSRWLKDAGSKSKRYQIDHCS